MHKEDGITKLIDGEVYYKFDYANFLYEELQKKDDEIYKYKNVIEKIKEYCKKETIDNREYRDIAYRDGLNNILKLLEEVE